MRKAALAPVVGAEEREIRWHFRIMRSLRCRISRMRSQDAFLPLDNSEVSATSSWAYS